MSRKRFRLLIVLSLLIFSVVLSVGCNSSGDNPKQSSESSGKGSTKSIATEAEFKDMYSEPNKFKGATIEFPAKIFLEPETDSDGVYFQCYAYNNENLNTVVAFNENMDLKDDDIVFIKGEVNGKFDSENAFGAKLSLAAITANSIDITDYATAFSPAIKTVDIDEEINQHGYVLKLEKVEFAEEETRAYLTITNESDNNISFYSFNSKATQGSTQLKEEDTYGKGYPEIESEILPGITESGVVVFTKSNPDEEIKLYFEGSSDDYSLDFKPFVFEVK